jgi:hypothetical protein
MTLWGVSGEAFVWRKNILTVLTKISTLIPLRQSEGGRTLHFATCARTTADHAAVS